MNNLDPLSPAKNFASLSLADLLYARDLFHIHLMNKRNVIATAVGRRLIRKKDLYPHEAKGKGASSAKGPKVLQECEVRYYSPPSVIVFVSDWASEKEFGKESGEEALRSSDYIPPAIYLPDGREVPICVVKAPLQDDVPAAPGDMAFPQKTLGGGYPLITRVQGSVHLASIGCLVTDGHKTYALTNRHVAGDPGERVYAVVEGKEIAIGTSSVKQLAQVPFSDLYRGWPGRDVLVNMDVGLVELDDLDRWTAQSYGIGALGRTADVNVDNLSLQIIGAPVQAYGCASRQMSGQIFALFYRYKSSGGFEHVTDFLIGPRHDSDLPLRTGPGDSGTVWLLEEERAKPGPQDRHRPIAIQWGGHRFLGGKEQYPFALAASLGNACAKLGVDVVRDWNVGIPDYWGAVGHFTIALKAIDALPDGALKKVMQANRLNITFDSGHIKDKEMKGLSKRPFIPLADVPDYSFKMGPRRAREQPNHFADMDRPRPSDGQTLLDLCKRDGTGIDVKSWQDYYTSVKDSGRGALPFRMWQCFDAMVDYARRGDLEHFVCAAGIVCHYVGDACQPLHISYLYDGDPDQPGYAKGVHAGYEDTMVNAYTPDLIARVRAPRGGPSEEVANGLGAAVMAVELMRRTLSTIKPRDILDAFELVKAQPKKDIAAALWAQFGDATVEVMSSGVAALAHFWEAAWEAGDGDRNVTITTTPIDHDRLAAIYKDEYEADEFLPSCTLNQIGAVLKAAAPATERPQQPRQQPRRRPPAQAHAHRGANGARAGTNGTHRVVRVSASRGTRVIQHRKATLPPRGNDQPQR